MNKKSLLLLLTCVLSLGLFAQDCKADWDAFIVEQMAYFTDPETCPLTDKDQAKFDTLDYYQYKPEYCVEADFIMTPETEVFEMATSTDRKPRYRQYGILKFELNGVPLQLSVYQNVDFFEKGELLDYLFIPFGDNTNGVDTYGAGRYIDMTVPDSDKVHLDFNQSYNPLCAYNYKYSCPQPPDENLLDVNIEAGVKGVHFKE